MSGDNAGEDPGGVEDVRLTSLEERLLKARAAEAERTAPAGGANPLSGKGVSQGNRVLSTLIGAPIGGAVIGFAIDSLAGTSPKALLAMLFLGMVAGFVEIWRISKERAE